MASRNQKVAKPVTQLSPDSFARFRAAKWSNRQRKESAKLSPLSKYIWDCSLAFFIVYPSKKSCTGYFCSCPTCHVFEVCEHAMAVGIRTKTYKLGGAAINAFTKQVRTNKPPGRPSKNMGTRRDMDGKRTTAQANKEKATSTQRKRQQQKKRSKSIVQRVCDFFS